MNKRYWVMKTDRVLELPTKLAHLAESPHLGQPVSYTRVPKGTVFDLGEHDSDYDQSGDYLMVTYHGSRITIPKEYLTPLDNLELLQYMGAKNAKKGH